MILLPRLYLLAIQIRAITVSFITAEMKHCAVQGEDMALRMGSKQQFELQCKVLLGGTNDDNQQI
jgi:hypothetical protein